MYLSSGSAKVSQVKSSSNAPRALIIEPSKELAEQTLNNVNQFKKYVDNPKLRWAESNGGAAVSVCWEGLELTEHHDISAGIFWSFWSSGC